MTPETVIADLSARFDDVHPVESWGETALFHNPDGAMKRGVYFATVKRKDGAHDRASALDRAGAWRLNLGLPPAFYEARFGPRPARPARGGVVATGHDFTAPDELMPHPVYAWMGWVAVVSPSRSTYDALAPLIGAAFDKARQAAARRLRAEAR